MLDGVTLVLTVFSFFFFVVPNSAFLEGNYCRYSCFGLFLLDVGVGFHSFKQGSLFFVFLWVKVR